MLKLCSLSVPPGAKLKIQITTEECKTTKYVANLRIYAERAINRRKTFRILKSKLPVTILHNIGDIVKTCAALCNLKTQSKPTLYISSFLLIFLYFLYMYIFSFYII